MAEEKIRCPHCAEEILAAANKCKHCGEWLKGGKSQAVQTKSGNSNFVWTAPASTGIGLGLVGIFLLIMIPIGLAAGVLHTILMLTHGYGITELDRPCAAVWFIEHSGQFNAAWTVLSVIFIIAGFWFIKTRR